MLQLSVPTSWPLTRHPAMDIPASREPAWLHHSWQVSIALMVEANPDITPTEFKDIISAHSIERDLQLLDDPGFNDCSILETRPDNEFGYGQADPLAFVEATEALTER